MSSDIIISVREYSFWYPDGTQALKDIDLVVRRGEFLTIMGRNGAGKTTLCFSLVGIIPNIFPGRMKGEILVAGKVPSEHSVYEVTKDVGIVLQDPESQIFTHSVFSEVTFAAENLGLPREEILERAYWALEVVRLRGFEERSPRHLSGGQKQRLAIASVLVTKPKVLVLDEPTSQLDPVGTREVLDTLKRLNREEGITIIMTEHKTDEVLDISDRIAILDKGKLVCQGPPDEVLQEVSMFVDLGLKPPEVAEVFWRLRSSGLDLDRIPITLDEAIATFRSLFRKSSLTTSQRIKEYKHSMSTKSSGIILKIRDVSYEYPGSPPVKALDKVNLSISEGEFIAIVGKNGSGKTTLLKCIFGLLKPTEGEVLFRGKNILEFPARERVRKLSLVLQNPDHQLFSMSVEDEIRFGLKNVGLGPEDINKRIDDVLSMVGLNDYKKIHPFQLSFGDRKKLAVASIVALDPDIIVLDEPTTGQDYKGRIEICDLAKKLNMEGKTILMVTHDMDLVARYAKRMVVMNEGRIIFDGSVREGFRRVDILSIAGLMPPKVTLFSQSLEDYGIPPDVLTVDELVDILSVGG